MAWSIFGQLDWLTTRVKRLCCAVDQIKKSGAGSYRVYIALLNQDDLSNPIVLENTLGEDITWTAGIAGGEFYGATPNPIFTENKVIGFAYSGGDANDIYLGMLVTRISDAEIKLFESTGYTPNLLIRVEIRVYE